jgi:hypothetical protein
LGTGEVKPYPVVGEKEDLVVPECVAGQNAEDGEAVLEFEADQGVIEDEKPGIGGIGVIVVGEKDASEKQTSGKGREAGLVKELVMVADDLSSKRNLGGQLSAFQF